MQNYIIKSQHCRTKKTHNGNSFEDKLYSNIFYQFRLEAGIRFSNNYTGKTVFCENCLPLNCLYGKNPIIATHDRGRHMHQQMRKHFDVSAPLPAMTRS